MGEHSHASAHWSALSQFCGTLWYTVVASVTSTCNTYLWLQEGQRLHNYVQKHSYVQEQELLPG